MRKQAVLFGLVATLAVSVLSAQQGPSLPLVRIETTLGNIDIEVDTAHAPITSANFLRYVFGGFYDGGEFYRAARPDTYHAVPPNRPPMELIEARIPAGRQAYAPIPLERTSVTGLHHVVGTVAMGRNDDQPDSAAFDFYVLLNDQPSLDFGGKRFADAQGTAAFGRVVAGMDVVRAINQQPVASRAATADNPLRKTQNLDPPIRINKAYRVRPPGSPRVGATFTKEIKENVKPPDPSAIGLGPNMIGGLVHQITGAPLAGATATLSGPALAAPRVATTDRDGKYQFTDLAPGTYMLVVESSTPGFKKASYPNLVMVTGFSMRLDCLLEWSGAMAAARLPGQAADDALSAVRAALGGDAALSRITSIHAVGHVVQSGGTRDGTLEVYFRAPNQFVRVTRVAVNPAGAYPGATIRDGRLLDRRLPADQEPGYGSLSAPDLTTDVTINTSRVGFNGQTAIASGSGGAYGLGAGARQYAAFIIPLLARLTSAYPAKVTTSADRVAFTGDDGFTWALTLDAATRLPAELSWSGGTATSAGPVITLSDYRSVGSVRWPFRLVMRTNTGLVEDVTIKRYEINTRINDKVFR